MFRNTRNRAWYFHFFRACFNFETTETFGLSQFSSCFNLFQFFPYISHCFSVSKHRKWGLVFSLFPELVSVLFQNVSKQLEHLDLVHFLPVSVRFSFFPIQSIVSVFRNTRNGAWYFHFFQSLFQFCFETTETFGLSQFSSCFSPFQFFPYIIHCFSVSKHQKWGLVSSLFQSLFQFCLETFRNN